MSGTGVLVVVDDNEAVRATVAMLGGSVGLDVVEFASVRQMDEGLPRDVRGCLLLDMRLPGLSGIPAIHHVASNYPGLVIMVFSGHADARTVVRALRAGAVDFFDKPFSNQELLEAVQAAIAGQAEAPWHGRPAVTADLSVLMRTLTRKQRTIVEMYRAGLGERTIAAKLDLHPRSVQRHLQNAVERLGVPEETLRGMQDGDAEGQ
ncbi:response regulator transcription factor [Marinibaculum pumilum]|uniref:Response regulator transcription factor n=1 Tax=Marinibaculum pumilum TaxID=1766165 RepID=A0ABV7KTU4_9PROT